MTFWSKIKNNIWGSFEKKYIVLVLPTAWYYPKPFHCHGSPPAPELTDWVLAEKNTLEDKSGVLSINTFNGTEKNIIQKKMWILVTRSRITIPRK